MEIEIDLALGLLISLLIMIIVTKLWMILANKIGETMGFYKLIVKILKKNY